MKTQIIQLDEHDDVLSAKDKIGWSQANRVLLIWPDEGDILSRRIDLVLLQRHVQGLGGRLALITRSRQVKNYARRLGVPVFRSPKQAQRVPWRSIPKKSIGETASKERRNQLFKLREQALAGRPRLPSGILQRLVPFLGGFLAVAALVFFFLPSAAITLDPVEQPQDVTLDVWADPTILSPNASGSIPAHIVSVVVEGQQQAASTGRATLPAATSIGFVRLTNLTGAEVGVPAGTVVLTLDSPPVRFETSERATVAAGPGMQTDVPVRSILAGSGGNVAPGEIAAIEGSLGLSLSVDNAEPTSGGADRNSPSPSDADYDSLRAALIGQLQQDALAQMQAGLEQGFTLLKTGLRQRAVLQETRQPEAGQPGERLLLKMRVEYTTWTVSEQDTRHMAETVLNAGLPGGFLDVPGSLEMQNLSEPQPEGDRIHWQIHAARRIYHPVDPAGIARSIAGRSPNQASQLLRQQISLQSDPVIQITPGWWRRLPFLTLRIQVVEL